MPPRAGPRVHPDVADRSVDVPFVDPEHGGDDGGTPWAHDPVFACSGEMAERMRAHPWLDDALGAPEQWPAVLRTTVSMVLRSKYPMTLTWGEQFLMLYNDAYVPVLGDKHPAALGRPLSEQFPEIWGAIGPMQDAVLRGAEATWDENLPLVLERGNGPEECFFTFSYSPVPDGGQPGGPDGRIPPGDDRAAGGGGHRLRRLGERLERAGIAAEFGLWIDHASFHCLPLGLKLTGITTP